MLSAEMIPQFNDKTPTGARLWWEAMLEKGFYIHPEDDPSNIVIKETGERALDDSACAKVTKIYEEMFISLGEAESYDVGQTAWYNFQGYEWDARKEEFLPKAS